MKPRNILAILSLILFLPIYAQARTIAVPGDQRTILAGVNAAGVGDTVSIAAGNYTGDGNRAIHIGRRIVIRSEEGPEATSIDLELVQGMTAFYVEAAGVTIEGIRFNRAWRWAVDIRNVQDIGMRECQFVGGRNVNNIGVAIQINGGSLFIEKSRFSGNFSGYNPGGGGGIFAYGGARVTIRQCEFLQNQSVQSGAALYVFQNSTADVMNSLFEGNTSRTAGGAVGIQSGILNITNCTITNNRSNDAGGGVYKMTGANANILNSVIYANAAQQALQLKGESNDGRFRVANSLVEGGVGGGVNWQGENIIDDDPLFREGEQPVWGTNGFFLDRESPCVDAGSIDAEEAGLSEMTTQINHLPDAGTVDLGYHYNAGDIENEANLFGFVYDAATGDPLAEVRVWTTNNQEATTDGSGYWEIAQPTPGEFMVTAEKAGYNDSTLADLEVGLADTLQIDFSLLHPEFQLSQASVSTELVENDSASVDLSVTNSGNGWLNWRMEKLPGEGEEGEVLWLEAGPDSADMEAQASLPLDVWIRSGGLAEGAYHARLKFTHNALPFETMLPVELTVLPPDGVADETNLNLPNSPIMIDITPNPFNSEAIVTISSRKAGTITAGIWDTSGRLVRMESSGLVQADTQKVHLNGGQLGTGVYLYRVEVDGRFAVRKFALIK